jgi:hypothetical protein
MQIPPAPADADAGGRDDNVCTALWIKQHPRQAAGRFAEEGLLWVTGCCDQSRVEEAAAQVDEALLAALVISEPIEHGRWFGDIRARNQRYDLRLRMIGAVQQVPLSQYTSISSPLSRCASVRPGGFLMVLANRRCGVCLKSSDFSVAAVAGCAAGGQSVASRAH